MLDSLHIKNFRCFEDLTIPSLGRVNLIVGKNNSGKSTLLDAIMLLSEESSEQHNSYFPIHVIKEILLNRKEKYSSDAKSISALANKKPYNIYIGDISKNKFVAIEFSGTHKKLSIKMETKSGESESFFDEQMDIIKNHLNTSEIRAYLEDFDLDYEEEIKDFYYLSTSNLKSESKLSRDWDSIIKFNKKNDALDLIKKIFPELGITDINFIEDYSIYDNDNDEEDGLPHRTGWITSINHKTRTLKSMGDGISRLLQIVIGIYNIYGGGFLLIDEFENGLHYSIQEEVWEKLFKLAKELDIQVFATTHSEDAVKAFCKVALASDEEGRLIALGRSPIPEKNGRIVAVSYDEKEIAVISRTGMEVR